MRQLIFPSAVLGLALLVSACDASGPEPATTSVIGTQGLVSSENGVETAARVELARAFALALGSSPAVRNEVRRNLADSRYTTEHKLSLQGHLAAQAQANPGKSKLLRAMASSTGRTTDEILALTATADELEFYLPVAEHRARWRAGKDMIVAVLTGDESEPPLGFDLDGEPVALSADAPPETPVLSIVSVETDFTEELPADYVNTDDGSGQSIGTLAPSMAASALAPVPSNLEVYCPPEGDELRPECGSGSGGGSSGGSTPGVYYTAADLDFVGEAWAKGQPEIEVFVIPTYDPENYDYPTDWSATESPIYHPGCSAGNDISNPLRKFDQNSESWSGRALLLDEPEMIAVSAPGNKGTPSVPLAITLWEDDYVDCELHTSFGLGEFITEAGGVALATGVTVFGGIAVDPTFFLATFYYGFYTAVYVGVGTYRFFATSDDFLGLAIEASALGESGNATYNYVLKTSNNGRNGSIKLETVR